jgi:hypothetical protein
MALEQGQVNRDQARQRVDSGAPPGPHDRPGRGPRRDRHTLLRQLRRRPAPIGSPRRALRRPPARMTVGEPWYGTDIRIRFGELGAYHVDCCCPARWCGGRGARPCRWPGRPAPRCSNRSVTPSSTTGAVLPPARGQDRTSCPGGPPRGPAGHPRAGPAEPWLHHGSLEGAGAGLGPVGTDARHRDPRAGRADLATADAGAASRGGPQRVAAGRGAPVPGTAPVATLRS